MLFSQGGLLPEEERGRSEAESPFRTGSWEGII